MTQSSWSQEALGSVTCQIDFLFQLCSHLLFRLAGCVRISNQLALNSKLLRTLSQWNSQQLLTLIWHADHPPAVYAEGDPEPPQTARS